jgi:hypothetical protein
MVADDAGQHIVALMQKASDMAKADCQRAMDVAHRVSTELRAAEERAREFEAEAIYFRERAALSLAAKKSFPGVERTSDQRLGSHTTETGLYARDASTLWARCSACAPLPLGRATQTKDKDLRGRTSGADGTTRPRGRKDGQLQIRAASGFRSLP